MSGSKQNVTIKGTKDGLVFLLDDRCDFADLVMELEEKMNSSFAKFADDTAMMVTVKFGQRQASEQQKHIIGKLISSRGNLTVQSYESEPVIDKTLINRLLASNLTVQQGTVRSGQVLQHNGNLLHLGDINPGGSVICTGDIYVLGALRGMAHAGCEGNIKSVIAASLMKPTQLRIATVISRPPDEWITDNSYMDFAWLDEGTMKIDKISNIHRIRERSEGN